MTKTTKKGKARTATTTSKWTSVRITNDTIRNAKKLLAYARNNGQETLTLDRLIAGGLEKLASALGATTAKLANVKIPSDGRSAGAQARAAASTTKAA